MTRAGAARSNQRQPPFLVETPESTLAAAGGRTSGFWNPAGGGDVRRRALSAVARAPLTLPGVSAGSKKVGTHTRRGVASEMA